MGDACIGVTPSRFSLIPVAAAAAGGAAVGGAAVGGAAAGGAAAGGAAAGGADHGASSVTGMGTVGVPASATAPGALAHRKELNDRADPSTARQSANASAPETTTEVHGDGAKAKQAAASLAK